MTIKGNVNVSLHSTKKSSLLDYLKKFLKIVKTNKHIVIVHRILYRFTMYAMLQM